jgi:hypothetical protein
MPSTELLRLTPDKEVPPSYLGGFLFGAEGGSRTHTPFRAKHFECSASAISPLRLVSSKKSKPFQGFLFVGVMYSYD